MKKLLLLLNMLFIYLFSSVASIPILEPHLWLSMDFSYFHIPVEKLFSLDSGFYDYYKVHWDLHFIAHKLAHFIFFGSLALLFLWNIKHWKHACFFAWFFTTLYGVTDELHQFATPGRTGAIQDVGVDSVSAIIWLVIFYLIFEKNKK